VRSIRKASVAALTKNLADERGSQLAAACSAPSITDQPN
jgi:hypothetical protein